MTLLQMSLAGGLLIAVICVLHLLLQHRLHRSVLLALWILAILRLLVPVFISSELSVFNLPVFSREESTAITATAEAVETPEAAVPVLPIPTIAEINIPPFKINLS